MPSSNEYFVGNKVTAFLRYKDGSEDRFIVEFNADRSINKIVKKVWVNDVLTSEMGSDNVLPGITIIR